MSASITLLAIVLNLLALTGCVWLVVSLSQGHAPADTLNDEGGYSAPHN